jgi:acetyl-CoA carboxylase biotin carboxyl carrier protein
MVGDGLRAGGRRRAAAAALASAAPVSPRVPHGEYALGASSEHRRISEVTDVEAHITGTVWKIEVAVGDSVEEGDTVVILESMKMEMPVEAEDPGVVKEIRCEEGQSVSEGDTLVVLE